MDAQEVVFKIVSRGSTKSHGVWVRLRGGTMIFTDNVAVAYYDQEPKKTSLSLFTKGLVIAKVPLSQVLEVC